MSDYALSWDNVGERFYEIGVDHGVFYPLKDDGSYEDGEAWSGLSKVTNKAEGGDVNDIWADNMKYAVLRSAETYGGTIEAYTYPEEFKQNNGEADLIVDGQGNGIPGITASGQSRKAFGFSFRTKVGNDIDGLDHGYKIHIVYNATVNPSEKAYQTINDSPDAITMSWEFQTTPIKAEGTPLKNATAHIEIDTTKFEGGSNNKFIKDLEQYLYGTPASGNDAEVEAKLPLPSKIVEIYNNSLNP